jgi:hypothetical protein
MVSYGEITIAVQMKGDLLKANTTLNSHNVRSIKTVIETIEGNVIVLDTDTRTINDIDVVWEVEHNEEEAC